MIRRNRLILILLIVGILILVGFIRSVPSTSGGITAQIVLPETTLAGYRHAEGPTAIHFPDDNGPHNEYLTEWWYYTGNLEDPNGHHFGYQLTFFRRALTPVPPPANGKDLSDWRTNQAYSIHFALSDITSNEFRYTEEFSRGAVSLAGAQADPYRVWLNQYQVAEQEDGSFLLEASNQDIEVMLTLRDTKGAILNGIEGYSKKGSDPGNASFYISQTHLESQGTILKDGKTYKVSGLSWMDHEYSTSALGSDLVGWDWFSIHLDDTSELMLYQLRNDNGTIDPFSSGTLIKPDGDTYNLVRDDFEIRVLDTWTSPHSDTVYPSAWQIEIPSEDLSLVLRPYMTDQELQVSITYWEGAIFVEGTKEGTAISGSGYAELTGYDESIAGKF